MASRAEMTKHILETVATGVGGGFAGYVDTKYASKKVGGMSLGTVGAIVAVGLGIAGVGGSRIAGYLRDGGNGAGAFELGKIVSDRTAKSMQSSQQKALGTSGVGALGQGRGTVTRDELNASIAALSKLG